MEFSTAKVCMMDGIGDFDSFDLQGKILKIAKTEEEAGQDREKFRNLFPEPEVKPALPQFLLPEPQIIRGPVELAASAQQIYRTQEGFANTERGISMAIPTNPAPEGFEHLVEKAIATPPTYPPPSIDEPLPAPHSHAAKELPQSNAFWEGFDMHDDPPPRRNFEETEEPALVLRKKEAAVEQGRPVKKKGALNSQEQLLAAVQPANRNKTDEETEREAKPLILPDPLPSPMVLMSEKAAASATSYLNPVTETLFRALVGSIAFVQKTTPGVNRTEITLNGEALNKSPFYNATIIIEEHSTAPGSYNITLQGSPQAVQIFQTNLPSLASAFETAYGKRDIPFRVSRLEASLSSRWSGHPRRDQSDEEMEE